MTSRLRPDKRRPGAVKSGEVAISRGKRATFLVATAILVVICAEGLSAIALRFAEGQWPYLRRQNVNYLLFEPHPEWVLAPRKGVTVTVNGHYHHHNTDGFRGQELARVKMKRRIACLGGSTTYGVGVADDQTWACYLDQLLQPDYAVLNFGIPGHSSVEHKKLLPQILARYSPDIVLLQMGLNDLRNMHVADLGPDYANFHQPSLFAASGFCRRDRLPRSALLQATVAFLEKVRVLSVYPFPKGFPAGHVSDAVDPYVVEVFSANLDTILRQCRAKHIRVVLLPHALSPEMINETNYKWWAPYLTKKGIFNAVEALNAAMQRRADGDWVIYAGFINGTTWHPAEFCDPTHLNSNGNLRFARLLKDGVPWHQFLSKEDLNRK